MPPDHLQTAPFVVFAGVSDQQLGESPALTGIDPQPGNTVEYDGARPEFRLAPGAGCISGCRAAVGKDPEPFATAIALYKSTQLQQPYG